MEAVTPVTTANAADPSTAVQAGAAGYADYDTFLTLLVTQLRNQDPTQPTDHAELVAQLASFSAVEQQTQTNDKLEQLLAVMSLDQASSLIGKHFTSSDKAVSGVIESITFHANATIVTLENGEQAPLSAGVTISNPQSGA